MHLPHSASTNELSKGHGGSEILGDNTSTEAVVSVVGAVHCLFKRLELQDALNWTKDLVDIILFFYKSCNLLSLVLRRILVCVNKSLLFSLAFFINLRDINMEITLY